MNYLIGTLIISKDNINNSDVEFALTLIHDLNFLKIKQWMKLWQKEIFLFQKIEFHGCFDVEHQSKIKNFICKTYNIINL